MSATLRQMRKISHVARAAPYLSVPQTVSIVGAPFSLGQPRVGVELGPKQLREHGLAEDVMNWGWRVVDEGDIESDIVISSSTPRHDERPFVAHHAEAVGKANHMLAEKVHEVCHKGHFSLVLGGDHSVGIGSLAGMLRARPNAGVCWVDAHADIHTAATSPSKNIHGMVLSFLTGLQDPREVPGFDWLFDYFAKDGEWVPPLSPKDLVYVGLRDLEYEEKVHILESGIRYYTMHDVDRFGIGGVMQRVVSHLTEDGERPLHLSFDVDAVDPLYVPATGTAVRGGLSFREAHFICEELHNTGMLGSMDCVEVNPLLADPSRADSSADVAKSLVVSALGDNILPSAH
ncbi:MAG: hypothetical protein MHM6MM_005042 [Cercozoa sp. M6MM]